jgi:cell wall-associated NlpC family hydrolase
MVTGADVVRAARGWIDVPFHHMGRDRQGIDCVGLVVVVSADAGIPVADALANYTRRAHGPQVVQAAAARGTQINIREAVPGDVLIFAEGNHPCHVGFLTDVGGVPHFVHAFGRLAYMRVRETPLAGEWKKKLRMAFRLNGVEDPA